MSRIYKQIRIQLLGESCVIRDVEANASILPMLPDCLEQLYYFYSNNGAFKYAIFKGIVLSNRASVFDFKVGDIMYIPNLDLRLLVVDTYVYHTIGDAQTEFYKPVFIKFKGVR